LQKAKTFDKQNGDSITSMDYYIAVVIAFITSVFWKFATHGYSRIKKIKVSLLF
jgi:hypothetical protein